MKTMLLSHHGIALALLKGMMLSLVLSAVAAASAQHPAAAVPQRRVSDEHLQFYPSTARSLPDGRLALRVEAWVYERETRPGLRSLLARYLQIDRDALSDEDRARYDERTQFFRFDSERGKDIRIVGDDGASHALPRTRSDGRSSAEVVLSSALPRDNMWLSFRGALSGRQHQNARPDVAGRALWVPDVGLSLVSDIDDTIKDSNVLIRRELLLNTFVRPFAAVGGMAASYRGFAQARPDLRVHYVSGSPHQLYPALSSFLDAAQFPPGSLHLRDVNFRTEIFGNNGGTRAHKLAIIRRLIADYPNRRFVLIGDSGEQDPEVYAVIARENPERVLAIWIRDVTGQSRDHPRYGETFAGIAPERWHLFADSGEIVLPDATP
jgi:Uncharacterized conserved protein (DUF2183)